MWMGWFSLFVAKGVHFWCTEKLFTEYPAVCWICLSILSILVASLWFSKMEKFNLQVGHLWLLSQLHYIISLNSGAISWIVVCRVDTPFCSHCGGNTLNLCTFSMMLAISLLGVAFMMLTLIPLCLLSSRNSFMKLMWILITECFSNYWDNQVTLFMILCSVLPVLICLGCYKISKQKNA